MCVCVCVFVCLCVCVLQTPPDLPGFMLRHGDEVAANLQLRAKYLGEIHGMTLVQSLLAQDSKTNTGVYLLLGGGGQG